MQNLYLLEDDPIYRQFLTQQLKNIIMIEKLPFQLQLATADPQAIMTELTEEKPHAAIFFLDIEIANSTISGIDLATFIRTHVPAADIIFVTNHPESALLIVTNKIMPLDLIQKDLSADTCAAMIHQDLLDIAQRLTHADDQVTYRFAGIIHAVDLAEISYLMTVPGDPGTLSLISDHETAEFHGNLNDYEARYPQLFRCHKSYLVNLAKVTAFDAKKRQLTFAEAAPAAVSFRKVASIRKQLLTR